MNEIIRYEQLRKSVQGQLLLNIDHFSINEGVCIALSGRNGAGKSTLMRIIAGLESPDSARVTYLGQPMSWQRARKRIRTHIIYLHQQPYLFDYSVSRNIAFGLRCLDLPRDDIAVRVSDALDWAGLKHLASRNAHELSGGERQRVALTRARILHPKLLLLDEPTSNMDNYARQQTYEMISKLKHDGVSILLSTHEFPAMIQLADEHLNLSDGQLNKPVIAPMKQRGNVVPYR
jgi:tungstate transport system ATP-binding protein